MHDHQHFQHVQHTAALDRDLGPVPPLAAGVTRIVRTSFDDLSARLGDHDVQAGIGDVALGDRRRLTLDAPLRRSDGPYPAWRGQGRIHGPGAGARTTRVEIELSPWSSTAVELRLRPTHRHPWRWGVRRQRRYVDLSHRAADRLAAVLGVPAPSEGGTPGVTGDPLGLAA